MYLFQYFCSSPRWGSGIYIRWYSHCHPRNALTGLQALDIPANHAVKTMEYMEAKGALKNEGLEDESCES